jgi:chromosomal replication initiator protein
VVLRSDRSKDRQEIPYRSYPQIARRFGDRDHTTIMYGSNKIARLIREDWTVAYDVAHLEAML